MDNPIDNESFISVEQPVEDKPLPQREFKFTPLPQQSVGTTFEPAPSTHPVGDKIEFTPLPNNVAQDQNNVIEHQDIGKPYSFFKPDGEETYVSEGMKQMKRDAGLEQQQNNSTQTVKTESEQEISERIQRNREVIEIFQNSEKFTGAFREISFSNGSKGLIFERNMVNFNKGELPDNSGIAEQYTTPQSFKDTFQEKRSVMMFTEEGTIFLVAGSTYRRHESEYDLIYKEVMKVKENKQPDAKVFQMNFSNQSLGLPTVTDSIGVKGEEQKPFSEKDTNFYSALYMENSLDNNQEGLDVNALLKEFADASELTKKPISTTELIAMIEKV